jgi:hypothetical protein
VLSSKDLELAQKTLEQQLLVSAKQLAEAELARRNAESPKQALRLMDDQRLTKIVYEDISLPTDHIGQAVTSIPISGGMSYTVYAYDAQSILAMLRHELEAHVRDGRRLLEQHLGLESLVVNPIAHADDESWIKLTVDLTGTEQYILDPLSPTGALFGKKLRAQISGMNVTDAKRIIKNLPEVESVSISQWPPWQHTLPQIPSHISIVPQ